MRERYRLEMNCQIIHDSIHSRPGWTQEYLLSLGGTPVGYGSIAVSGPWKEKPTVYEYYVLPPYRTRVFDLFQELLQSSGATRIETQSNDPHLTVMLHTFAKNVASEAILFHDMLKTAHCPVDATFRKAKPADHLEMKDGDLDTEAKWIVSVRGAVAGAGSQ